MVVLWSAVSVWACVCLSAPPLRSTLFSKGHIISRTWFGIIIDATMNMKPANYSRGTAMELVSTVFWLLTDPPWTLPLHKPQCRLIRLFTICWAQQASRLCLTSQSFLSGGILYNCLKLEPLDPWGHQEHVDIHWNGNVVILMKFSSLAALEVVILTTSGAASDENFVKMTTFSFQCIASRRFHIEWIFDCKYVTHFKIHTQDIAINFAIVFTVILYTANIPYLICICLISW